MNGTQLYELQKVVLGIGHRPDKNTEIRKKEFQADAEFVIKYDTAPSQYTHPQTTRPPSHLILCVAVWPSASCLRDLDAMLGHDSKEYQYIHFQCGSWDLIKHVLLPTLYHGCKEQNIVAPCIRILVRLTMPLEPIVVENRIQRLEQMQKAKNEIISDQYLTVLMWLLSQSMEVHPIARTQKQNDFLDLILTLLKNLLKIPDATHGAESQKKLHDRCIIRMFQEHVFETLGVLSTTMDSNTPSSTKYLLQDCFVNIFRQEKHVEDLFSDAENEVMDKLAGSTNKLSVDQTEGQPSIKQERSSTNHQPLPRALQAMTPEQAYEEAEKGRLTKNLLQVLEDEKARSLSSIKNGRRPGFSTKFSVIVKTERLTPNGVEKRFHDQSAGPDGEAVHSAIPVPANKDGAVFAERLVRNPFGAQNLSKMVTDSFAQRAGRKPVVETPRRIFYSTECKYALYSTACYLLDSSAWNMLSRHMLYELDVSSTKDIVVSEDAKNYMQLSGFFMCFQRLRSKRLVTAGEQEQKAREKQEEALEQQNREAAELEAKLKKEAEERERTMQLHRQMSLEATGGFVGDRLMDGGSLSLLREDIPNSSDHLPFSAATPLFPNMINSAGMMSVAPSQVEGVPMSTDEDLVDMTKSNGASDAQPTTTKSTPPPKKPFVREVTYDMSCISSNISFDAWKYLNTRVKMYLDDKPLPYPHLQAALSMYKELIRNLYEMHTYGSLSMRMKSDSMRRALFYDRESIELFVKLLEKWSPTKVDISFLADIVAAIHYQCKLLEDLEANGHTVLEKRRRKVKRKKEKKIDIKNPDDVEAIKVKHPLSEEGGEGEGEVIGLGDEESYEKEPGAASPTPIKKKKGKKLFDLADYESDSETREKKTKKSLATEFAPTPKKAWTPDEEEEEKKFDGETEDGPRSTAITAATAISGSDDPMMKLLDDENEVDEPFVSHSNTNSPARRQHESIGMEGVEGENEIDPVPTETVDEPMAEEESDSPGRPSNSKNEEDELAESTQAKEEEQQPSAEGTQSDEIQYDEDGNPIIPTGENAENYEEDEYEYVDDDDVGPRTTRKESEFDFKKFMTRFAKHQVVTAYIDLLSHYRTNHTEINHMIYVFMQRFTKLHLNGFFCQIRAFVVFEKILTDEWVKKRTIYDPLRTWIKSLTREFLDAALKQPTEEQLTVNPDLGRSPNQHLWIELLFLKDYVSAERLLNDTWFDRSGSRARSAADFKRGMGDDDDEVGDDNWVDIDEEEEEYKQQERIAAQLAEEAGEAQAATTEFVDRDDLVVKAKAWKPEDDEVLKTQYEEFKDNDAWMDILQSFFPHRTTTSIKDRLKKLGVFEKRSRHSSSSSSKHSPKHQREPGSKKSKSRSKSHKGNSLVEMTDRHDQYQKVPNFDSILDYLRDLCIDIVQMDSRGTLGAWLDHLKAALTARQSFGEDSALYDTYLFESDENSWDSDAYEKLIIIGQLCGFPEQDDKEAAWIIPTHFKPTDLTPIIELVDAVLNSSSSQTQPTAESVENDEAVARLVAESESMNGTVDLEEQARLEKEAKRARRLEREKREALELSQQASQISRPKRMTREQLAQQQLIERRAKEEAKRAREAKEDAEEAAYEGSTQTLLGAQAISQAKEAEVAALQPSQDAQDYIAQKRRRFEARLQPRDTKVADDEIIQLSSAKKGKKRSNEGRDSSKEESPPKRIKRRLRKEADSDQEQEETYLSQSQPTHTQEVDDQPMVVTMEEEVELTISNDTAMDSTLLDTNDAVDQNEEEDEEAAPSQTRRKSTTKPKKRNRIAESDDEDDEVEPTDSQSPDPLNDSRAEGEPMDTSRDDEGENTTADPSSLVIPATLTPDGVM